MRSLDSENELRDAVRDLGARYGVDSAAICNELCMTWEEIVEVARAGSQPSERTRSIM